MRSSFDVEFAHASNARQASLESELRLHRIPQPAATMLTGAQFLTRLALHCCRLWHSMRAGKCRCQKSPGGTFLIPRPPSRWTRCLGKIIVPIQYSGTLSATTIERTISNLTGIDQEGMLVYRGSTVGEDPWAWRWGGGSVSSTSGGSS